jgi:crossover junction endodeoxyribonuclease RusA
MRSYKLLLPLPPTINHYYGSRGYQRFLSKAGNAFRQEVLTAWIKAHGRPLDGALRLKVTLHARDARRWDLDNRVKALQDAMQAAGVFANDWQINDLHVVRGEIVRPNGGCVVDIAEVQ